MLSQVILTISETKLILEDGITVGGKALREHFEVINHQEAITSLEEIVHPSYKLKSLDLLSIHRMVMTNIMDDYAGGFMAGMVRKIA
jgi:Fic family protein